MLAPIHAMSKHKAQTKILALSPGLYLFRYGGPLTPGESCIAVLAKAPLATNGTIAFLSNGNDAQPVLQSLGERLVARVEGGDVNLLLTLIFPAEAADPSVQIFVERLDGTQPALAQPRSDGSVPVELPVSLSGHVERQGDVAGAVGGWIGQPSGRHRVEGFTVLWPGRPDGVDISYSCMVAGFGRTSAALTGGFVGTRRRAAPILGVSIALVGEKAAHYELKVDAAFAGVGLREGRSGSELTGPRGTEPLVGLRVLVVPSSADAKAALTPAPTSPVASDRPFGIAEQRDGARTFVPQR